MALTQTTLFIALGISIVLITAYLTKMYVGIRLTILKAEFKEYYELAQRNEKALKAKIEHLNSIVKSSNQLLKVKSEKIQNLNEK